MLFKTTLVGCTLLFVKQLNCSRFGDGGQYKHHFCGAHLAVCGCVLFIITFCVDGVRDEDFPAWECAAIT